MARLTKLLEYYQETAATGPLHHLFGAFGMLHHGKEHYGSHLYGPDPKMSHAHGPLNTALTEAVGYKHKQHAAGPHFKNHIYTHPEHGDHILITTVKGAGGDEAMRSIHHHLKTKD